MAWRLWLTVLFYLGYANAIPLYSKELEVTEPRIFPTNLRHSLQHSVHQSLENSENLLQNFHSRLHTFQDSTLQHLATLKGKFADLSLQHLKNLRNLTQRNVPNFKEKLQNLTLQHLNTLKNLRNSTLQNVLNLQKQFENSTLPYKEIFPLNLLKDSVKNPNSEVYDPLAINRTAFESLSTSNSDINTVTDFMISNLNQFLNFNNLTSSESTVHPIEINNSQGKNESMENFNSINKQTSLLSENLTLQNSGKENFQTMINTTLPLELPASNIQGNNFSIINISPSTLNSSTTEKILSYTSTDIETSTDIVTSTHNQKTANVNLPTKNIFQNTNSSNLRLNETFFNSSTNILLEGNGNTETSTSESLVITNIKHVPNNSTTELPIILPEELDSITDKNNTGFIQNIAVSPPPISQEKKRNQIDIRFGISCSKQNKNGNLEESTLNNTFVKNTKRSADFFLFPSENNTNNINQIKTTKVTPVSTKVAGYEILKSDKNNLKNQSLILSTSVLHDSSKNETDFNGYETLLKQNNTFESQIFKSGIENVRLIRSIVSNMTNAKHKVKSATSCEKCKGSSGQIGINVELEQQNIGNKNISNTDQNMAMPIHNGSNLNSTNNNTVLEKVAFLNLNNTKTHTGEEGSIPTVSTNLVQILPEHTTSRADYLNLTQVNNAFLINGTMKGNEYSKKATNITKTLNTNRTAIEKLLHVIRKSYVNNKFSKTELRSIRNLLKRLLILFGEEKTYFEFLKSVINISKKRMRFLKTEKGVLDSEATSVKRHTRLVKKREVKDKGVRSRKARHDKKHTTIDIVRKINASEAEAALLALRDFTNYQQDDPISSEISGYYDDSDDDYNEDSYENEDVYSEMVKDEDYYGSSDEATFDELISLAFKHKARRQKLQENFFSHPVTNSPSETPKT